MPHFIKDNTGLAAAKSNFQVDASVPATSKVAASDWNEIRQALLDIQSFARGAEWLALSEQADAPAPDGISTYLYVDAEGVLQLHHDGNTAPVGGGGGGGGGITNGAGANVVMKSDGTNAVASLITDNGSTVAIASTSLNADTLTVTHNPASGTASTKAIHGLQQGSVDTSSSAKTMTGVRGEAITTRSAGANTLINVGVVGVASGSPTSNYAMYAICSGSGSDNRGVQVEQSATGTLNYGFHALVNGAGGTNIAIKVGAVNGSVTNRALECSDGDVVLNSQSGFTSITGHGSAADLSVSDATAGNTLAGAVVVSIANTQTFDTTASALTEYGVKIASSARRSTGGNPVTNVALDVTANGTTGTNNIAIRATAASGSGSNIALQTDAGINYLNATGGNTGVGYASAAALPAKLSVSGTFAVTGNVGFYGTSPAARPEVTGSRGGNAALASLLTGLASLGLLTDSSSA